MKLSRTTMYALHSIYLISQSRPGSFVAASNLSADGDMPKRFLLRVLRKLVEHDLLASKMGVDGGYFLRLPLDEISLLQVIEAVEGPIAANLLEEGQKKNSLNEKLYLGVAGIRYALHSVKLSDFLTPEHASPRQANSQRVPDFAQEDSLPTSALAEY